MRPVRSRPLSIFASAAGHDAAYRVAILLPAAGGPRWADHVVDCDARCQGITGKESAGQPLRIGQTDVAGLR